MDTMIVGGPLQILIGQRPVDPVIGAVEHGGYIIDRHPDMGRLGAGRKDLVKRHKHQVGCP